MFKNPMTTVRFPPEMSPSQGLLPLFMEAVCSFRGLAVSAFMQFN
jgi:hypothetical protein